MKKMLFTLMIVFSSFFLASCTKQTSLKLGKYQTEDKMSYIVLSENNEFVFARHVDTSYLPSGTYLIENKQLILTDMSGETYVFEINNGELIFQSGKMAEGIVDIGTVYKLSEES